MLLRVVRAPFENGARGLCASQDVLDFAGASLPTALDSFCLAGVFAVTAGLSFIAAAARAVRSLKDMSSILWLADPNSSSMVDREAWHRFYIYGDWQLNLRRRTSKKTKVS